MVNTSALLKLACAHSLLALLFISQAALASDSPAAAPCTQPSDSRQSCRVELPVEAIQKLKIDAGFGWGIFNGSIYNGNKNYHITQLTISMVPIHNHHHADMHASMSHEPRVHQIDLELPPATKGAISMPLPSEDIHIHDFKWEIIKVTGYPTR